MTPELIRSLWKLIEILPHDILLTHDQDSFVDLLIDQLKEDRTLDTKQIEAIKIYIKTKIPLICELNEHGQFYRSPYLSA